MLDTYLVSKSTWREFDERMSQMLKKIQEEDGCKIIELQYKPFMYRNDNVQFTCLIIWETDPND